MMTNKRHGVCADSGLFLIRLALGLVFIVSGWTKFMAIAGTTKFFASLGLASFWVYVVAFVEFFGGVALLFGLGTMVAGILLAIDMFFAILLAKFAMGFAAGYRLELTLLLTSLGIALTGPGKYSLHRLFCKNCDVGEGKPV